jgi:hypothetical protein
LIVQNGPAVIPGAHDPAGFACNSAGLKRKTHHDYFVQKGDIFTVEATRQAACGLGSACLAFSFDDVQRLYQFQESPVLFEADLPEVVFQCVWLGLTTSLPVV